MYDPFIWSDKKWLTTLADIFYKLNELNLSLQGTPLLYHAYDKVKVFQEKKSIYDYSIWVTLLYYFVVTTQLIFCLRRIFFWYLVIIVILYCITLTLSVILCIYSHIVHLPQSLEYSKLLFRKLQWFQLELKSILVFWKLAIL